MNTSPQPTYQRGDQIIVKATGEQGMYWCWVHTTIGTRIAEIVIGADIRVFMADEIEPAAAAAGRRATAAQMLHLIAAEVSTGLPHPLDIALDAADTGYLNGFVVDIRVADNAPAVAAAWAARIGLDPPTPGPVVVGLGGSSWRAHTAAGTWRGWRAEVWAKVDLPGGAA